MIHAVIDTNVLVSVLLAKSEDSSAIYGPQVKRN